jgi:hypothetical protein
MNFFARFLLVLMIAFFLVAGLGCTCGDDDDDDDDTSDDDDDDTVDDDDDTIDDDDDDDDHVEKGKEYLRASAAGYALAEFELALDETPDNPDAHYGIILANSLYEFDTISVIKSYIDMFLGFIEPEKGLSEKEEETLQNWLDELLDEVLSSLILDRNERMIEAYDAWMAIEDAPDFELDKMPIILNLVTVAEPGGLYDIDEAKAARALSLMLAGLIRHLVALNIDIDISYLLTLGSIDASGYSTLEQISIYVDYFTNLLNEPAYPDFLTFGEEGIEELKAAGLELGLGFSGATETLASMRTGVPNQEVLGYDDVNGNDAWNAGEPYVVPSYGALDADQMAMAEALDGVFAAVGASFLDYTPFDNDPDNPSPFDLTDLNPVLVALGIPGFLPSLEIDFGANYLDPDPEFLRDDLLTILNVAAFVLPPPPPY